MYPAGAGVSIHPSLTQIYMPAPQSTRLLRRECWKILQKHKVTICRVCCSAGDFPVESAACNITGVFVAKEKIRCTITSADLEAAYSCDCQKWIRHLAAHRLKTDDLHRLMSGRLPAGKLFVLDMMEFLRKTDIHLDRFLSGRGGIRQDDHLAMDFAAVRQLVNREFSELAAELADGEQARKVVKRRPGTVDLSPLAHLARKR